jgi:hypothetical protein
VRAFQIVANQRAILKNVRKDLYSGALVKTNLGAFDIAALYLNKVKVQCSTFLYVFNI